MTLAVSIIIATYNAEKFLGGCLNSITSQSFKNFEVIVVDGGSSDKTVEIIREHASNFSLKWVSERDEGIYDAWNKGIEISTGEWITFVGSDDIMQANWLDCMLGVAERNPEINYISALCTVVNKNLQPIRDIGKEWSGRAMRRFMNVAHVGSFHKRDLFFNHGVFNTRYKRVADYEFLLRVSPFVKAGFLNQSIGQVRLGGASDSISAIYEAREAKIKTGKVCYFKALLQYWWAVVAFYKRKCLQRLL